MAGAIRYISEQFGNLQLWAESCGGVKPSTSSTCFPPLVLAEEPSSLRAAQGAGAHLLAAFLMFILTALASIPLLFIGGLIRLINLTHEACLNGGVCKDLADFGSALFALGCTLPYTLCLSVYHLFGTIDAHFTNAHQK